MAWYNGTFSCGHKGSVNVVGKHSERQWKIDKYFEGICEECKTKRREYENKKLTEMALEYEFPELKGTEKQIVWANTIRMSFYNYCTENNVIADDIIINETDAKFWIDNRMNIKSIDFVNNYKTESGEQEFNRRIISEDTVKPSEIKHEGVVEIVKRENKICLYYEKNQYFINLVKSLKYKWNEVWNRELSETTGSFSDRAAEVGYKLLKNGFCICIHDKEIMNKAIHGEYEIEHTRWIYSRRNSTLLAISWEGKNDELYKSAKKYKSTMGWI